jgi:hypothetical protein
LYEGSITIFETTRLTVFTRKTGHQDSELVESFITIDPTSYRVPILDRALWLRADTGVKTVSSKVYQWDDLSGQGNHAVQATATNRPTIIPGAVNGKPAVEFYSAASQFLESPAPGADKVSVFVVFKNLRDSTENQTQIILERLNAATPSGYSLFMTNRTNRSFRINSGVSSTTLTSTAAGQYQVLAGTYDRSMRILWLDGSYYDYQTQTAAAGTPAFPIRIGGRGANNSVHGQIAEILVYNRDLSPEERIRTETYLYERYQVGRQPVASSPAASLESGTYISAKNVALTSSEQASQIHYTLDGTEPNSSSPIYTGALSITANTTLKAKTIRSPFLDSPTQTWYYAIDANFAFLPKTNLGAWFRGDIGIEQDSQNVTTWTDLGLVGQQHQLKSAVGASIIKKTLGLDFANDSEMLTENAIGLTTHRFSTFLVIKPRFDNNSKTLMSLKYSNNLSSGFDYSSIRLSNNQILANIKAGSIASLNSSWLPSYQVLGVSYGTDNTLRIYQNGYPSASASVQIPIFDVPSGIGQIFLSGNGTNSFNGEVAEVLYYSRELSHQERRDLHAYLSNKYNIIAARPSIGQLYI